MRTEIRDKLKSCNETQIDLRELSITDDDLVEIVNEIKKIRPQIHELYLRNNHISNKGAISLGKMLIELTQLSFIDLQFNSIDLEGAEGIFKLKLTHPDIRIALHGNMISDTSEMYKIEKKYII